MGTYLFFVTPHLRFFWKGFVGGFWDWNVSLILRCTEKSAPSNVYLTGKDEYLIRTTKYLNLQILNKFV